MKKEEFGRNGYYHIQIPHARRLVLDLIFGLHFEGEEPFTDPDRLPQWTPDYDRVCHWLTDNKGKGLLLSGGVGNGKTMFIRRIIPILLWNAYGKLMDYCTAVDLKLGDLEERKRATYLMAIDDLCTEDFQNEYGRIRVPFSEVMDSVDQHGGLVIASTNAKVQELHDKYGQRTFDRILKNMDIVFFEGESLRSKAKHYLDLDVFQQRRYDERKAYWTARKELLLSRTSERVKAKQHNERVLAWKQQQAAACGLTLEEWLRTKGTDYDYLHRLWLEYSGSNPSASFVWWLRARELWNDAFPDDLTPEETIMNKMHICSEC